MTSDFIILNFGGTHIKRMEVQTNYYENLKYVKVTQFAFTNYYMIDDKQMESMHKY